MVFALSFASLQLPLSLICFPISFSFFSLPIKAPVMYSSPGAQVAGSLIRGMLTFTDTLEMGPSFLKKEKKIPDTVCVYL